MLMRYQLLACQAISHLLWKPKTKLTVINANQYSVNIDYIFADTWSTHALHWMPIGLQYKTEVNKYRDILFSTDFSDFLSKLWWKPELEFRKEIYLTAFYKTVKLLLD